MLFQSISSLLTVLVVSSVQVRAIIESTSSLMFGIVTEDPTVTFEIDGREGLKAYTGMMNNLGDLMSQDPAKQGQTIDKLVKMRVGGGTVVPCHITGTPWSNATWISFQFRNSQDFLNHCGNNQGVYMVCEDVYKATCIESTRVGYACQALNALYVNGGCAKPAGLLPVSSGGASSSSSSTSTSSPSTSAASSSSSTTSASSTSSVSAAPSSSSSSTTTSASGAPSRRSYPKRIQSTQEYSCEISGPPTRRCPE